MGMKVAKISPLVNKPTHLISLKSSGYEMGLKKGDYCSWNKRFLYYLSNKHLEVVYYIDNRYFCSFLFKKMNSFMYL